MNGDAGLYLDSRFVRQQSASEAGDRERSSGRSSVDGVASAGSR